MKFEQTTERNWVFTQLKDVCSLITDGTHHSPPNFASGDFPYITAKNIKKHGLDTSINLTYVSKEIHEKIYARCPVEPKDVLYIKDGATTGLAAINTLQRPFSLLSSVALLKPITEALNPYFLKHWLNSPETFKQFTGKMTGTAIKRIVLKEIRDASIEIPPLTEQIRIAQKLDELLAQVDTLKARIDSIPSLLKCFRHSVLAAAASGQLTQEWRGSKDEPSNNIASSWQSLMIKEVGRVQLGRQRSPKYHSGSQMRPYLRVQNVFEDRIDLRDVMEMNFPGADFERYQLHDRDILLNEGQSPELLGRPAMFRGELENVCFTNTLIRFQASPIVIPEYALFIFRHYMHSGRFRSIGTITTNIAHLGAGRFAELPFPLPPLNEQTEIIRRVEQLFAFADQLEAKIITAKTRIDHLTQSILAKAFRGELVPQDPNDEPASVLLERIKSQRAAAPKAKRGRKASA